MPTTERRQGKGDSHGRDAGWGTGRVVTGEVRRAGVGCRRFWLLGGESEEEEEYGTPIGAGAEDSGGRGCPLPSMDSVAAFVAPRLGDAGVTRGRDLEDGGGGSNTARGVAAREKDTVNRERSRISGGWVQVRWCKSSRAAWLCSLAASGGESGWSPWLGARGSGSPRLFQCGGAGRVDMGDSGCHETGRDAMERASALVTVPPAFWEMDFPPLPVGKGQRGHMSGRRRIL